MGLCQAMDFEKSFLQLNGLDGQLLGGAQVRPDCVGANPIFADFG